VTKLPISRLLCLYILHLLYPYVLRFLYLCALFLFVAAVSTARVSELRASVDIPVLSDVLIPAFAVRVVDLDSRGHPKPFAFPNVDYHAISSSCLEVVGQESVHSSIDVHAIDALYSIVSTLGLHQNKILGHSYNKPSSDYNNVNDTNDLPIDATTNRSRKTDLRLSLAQHKHRPYQVARLPLAGREIRWVAAVAAEERQCVCPHLQLPS
jgi:hypothetical protein